MNFIDFLNPQAIAVIGASRDPNKVGSVVLKNLRITYKGCIIPVNPFADEIQDLRVYKSVMDVKEKIDIAIICVPADGVLKVLKDCEKKKVKLAVIISAGFKEVGGDGAKKEEEIGKFLKRAKIRVVGPNCLGLINTNPSYNTTFIDPNSKILKGHTALISQSGAILSAIVDDASVNNIGFSKIISIGNAVDIDEADIVDALKNDEDTKILAIYLEGIINGQKFMNSLDKFGGVKPVLVLKGGKFSTTSTAVSSHTGSMAGDYKAYELAFNKTGTISVDSIESMFNFMRDAAKLKVISDEVIIVTNAGGGGVVTTDHITAAGLKLARLSEKVTQNLSDMLPKEASLHNPVDILGDATPDRYRETLELLVNQGKPIIVLFSPQEMSMPLETAREIYEVKARHPDAVILSVFLGGSRVEKARNFLLERDMPIYNYPNEAVEMLRGMYFYDTHKTQTYSTYKRDKTKIAKLSVTKNLFGLDAKKVFDSIGIRSANGLPVRKQKDLSAVSAKIGYPCVLKVNSGDIPHKSRFGGVIVGIRDFDSLNKAFYSLQNRLASEGKKNLRYELYEDINKISEQKTEVLLGAHRDPQFGPMIAIGLGGVLANQISEVTFMLSQVSDNDISDFVNSKVGKVLSSATDSTTFQELIRYIIKLDKLMTVNRQIKDIDLNPIELFKDTMVATDFKIFV